MAKSVSRILGEWAETDPERLFRAARDIEELTEHPGWEVLLDLAQARADAVLDATVFSPGVLDQAEYAGKLGEVRGLKTWPKTAEVVLAHAKQARDRLEREVREIPA